MSIGEDAIRAIEAHRWPGNIRELENCLKRAVIMADGSRITREDIGLDCEADSGFIDLRKVRDEAERQAIVTALGRTNNNLVKTAEMLGISRPTLYDLMHRLGLKSQHS
jgi:two-component system NtrC family response regulator